MTISYDRLFLTAAAVATITVGVPQIACAGIVASDDGNVVTLEQDGGPAGLDYANAKAIPLPAPDRAPPSDSELSRQAPATFAGSPILSVGDEGDGTLDPATIPRLKAPASSPEVEPQEFGSLQKPYTTSQAAAYGDDTEKHFPFRASGRLFFKIGGDTYVCSASLIKKGIVVTAAHCVANFGKKQYYSAWQYVPALKGGSAPFGVWTTTRAAVLTSYFNGTDSCAVKGVVCKNDVAVLTLKAKSGKYAGTATGFFSFGINGYSFNKSKQALITQLGYPVALDRGVIMERNDAQGVVVAKDSNNTEIGSRMTGGSSGGPWLVNLGKDPAVSGTTRGTASTHNVVVGVTSWGYTGAQFKVQGASSFTATNITALVRAACKATPGAC